MSGISKPIVRELEDQIAILSGVVSDLEKRELNLKDSLSMLEIQKSNREKDLRDIEIKIDTLKHEIVREIDQSNDKLGGIKIEIVEKQAELADLQEKYTVIANTLSNSEKLLKEKSESLEGIRDDEARLNSQIADMNEALATAGKELEEEEDRLNKKRQDINRRDSEIMAKENALKQREANFEARSKILNEKLTDIDSTIKNAKSSQVTFEKRIEVLRDEENRLALAKGSFNDALIGLEERETALGRRESEYDAKMVDLNNLWKTFNEKKEELDTRERLLKIREKKLMADKGEAELQNG